MYELCRLNEQIGVSNVSVFPAKRSFLPSFIPLDVGIVASHISGLRSAQLTEARDDVSGFWGGIFKTDHKVFKQANKNTPDGWKQVESRCVSCEIRMGRNLKDMHENGNGANQLPSKEKQSIVI